MISVCVSQEIYAPYIHGSTMQKRSTDYMRCVVSNSFSYYRADRRQQTADLAEAVRAGLGSRPYAIPPRFFYDDIGSALFEDICSAPEYYQTRTEVRILKSIRHTLAEILDDRFRMVELGSGNSHKTRIILDALAEAGGAEYVPIDISGVLESGAGSLADDYPGVQVTGIVDTYEAGLALVDGMAGHNFVVFLGSSLGNMCPEESASFLRTVRSLMRSGDMLLLGLDLVKKIPVLEAAYNDSVGITARFNLNILSRINRELDADFDVSQFSHNAFYNAVHKRIEMHLVSDVNQIVHIPKAGITMALRSGDSIHTEDSYKYTIPDIYRLAREAGFDVQQLWTDEDKLFSVTLIKVA